MPDLIAVASNGAVTDYDRQQLALYAALLDAHANGVSWRAAAAELMCLDPDEEGSKVCWRSHLERAAWIVGEGLGQALHHFGRSEELGS